MKKVLTVFLSSIIFFGACLSSVYSSETAKRPVNKHDLERKIMSAYREADYITASKLLEDQIKYLKENASENRRAGFNSLYLKHILLAYIYAWNLDKPETALKEYLKAYDLRKSFTDQKAAKAPPFEFVLIGEIYEMKNDLVKAREYYQTFLKELIAVRNNENDTEVVAMTDDLINLLKYQIDSINLKTYGVKKYEPHIKRIKLSSQFTPDLMIFVAAGFTPTLKYNYGLVQDNDIISYIEQSKSNFSSMVQNYVFVLSISLDFVSETSEKAMQSYLLKYPESYYSLSLRYLFYKFYKENGQTDKAERLAKDLQKIADKRGIEIIIEPDKRFSSPEKTWEVYKEALKAGDIGLAMECYVPGIRTERKLFTLMGKDKLIRMAEEMGDIERVTGNDKRAKYRIMREYKDQEVSFNINFVNIDGEWKMYEF